jgi:glycosyltransferase involved in cell wall biosynthesis
MVGLERTLRPTRTVYRATDLYADMEGDPLLKGAAIEVMRSAALVVGTSEPVLKELKELAPGKPYLLLENGVDVALFSEKTEKPIEYAEIGAPRVVYAGALDTRFDFNLIAEAARALDWVNFVLIGPSGSPGESQELRKLSNVHLLGARAYTSLPGFFQHAQLGLLPFSQHPANAGRSPMKLFEYGAAGLPVVAMQTPEIARRKLRFVLVARTAEEFVGHIRTALHDDANRIALGIAARQAAGEHDWATIAKRLLGAAVEAQPD